MATTIYLVVSGMGTTAQVERYFYGTTRWQAPSEDLDEYRMTASILAVTEDSASQCERSAEQQADRLRSGMYGVLTVDTLADANDHQRLCYGDAVRRISERQDA